MRLALLLALLCLAGPVAAQTCASALDRAEEQYRSGSFDSAIAGLDRCLQGTTFTPEQRQQAFRLVGLSYIGKNREAEARDAVRALLEVAPDYRADPAIDPPPYVAMVDEVRRTTPRRTLASGAARPVSAAPGLSVALRGQGTTYSEDGDSASGGGGDVVVGYGFSPRLGAYVRLEGSGLDGGFTLGSVGVGGRYYVGGGERKLVPFVGAGATFQSLSISSGGITASVTGPGGEAEAGLLYFFSPSLGVDLGVAGQVATLSNSTIDSYSATTGRVGLGLRWQP